MSLISVDLPEPDTPVMAGEQAGRDFQVDVLQVVAGRAEQLQHHLRARACGACVGHFDALLAGEVLAGQRARRLEHVGIRALRDDFAAMHAGAGADVDDVVGKADRILVVLDDDHGVAEVAQARERAEQALVVALVQADRRFVEHVHHADQSRADLRGEADALRFAAGQAVGLAIEREVIEADIDEEAQPLADFLDDLRPRSRRASPAVAAARRTSALRRSAGSRSAAVRVSPTKTLRALRFRRAPPQSGHGRSLMYLASSSRTAADSVSR